MTVRSIYGLSSRIYVPYGQYNNDLLRGALIESLKNQVLLDIQKNQENNVWGVQTVVLGGEGARLTCGSDGEWWNSGYRYDVEIYRY